MIKYMMGTLAAITATYGVFVFVLMDLNPISWGQDLRFMFIITSTLPIYCSCAFINLYSDGKPH